LTAIDLVVKEPLPTPGGASAREEGSQSSRLEVQRPPFLAELSTVVFQSSFSFRLQPLVLVAVELCCAARSSPRRRRGFSWGRAKVYSQRRIFAENWCLLIFPSSARLSSRGYPVSRPFVASLYVAGGHDIVDGGRESAVDLVSPFSYLCELPPSVWLTAEMGRAREGERVEACITYVVQGEARLRGRPSFVWRDVWRPRRPTSFSSFAAQLSGKRRRLPPGVGPSKEGSRENVPVARPHTFSLDCAEASQTTFHRQSPKGKGWPTGKQADRASFKK